MSMTAGNLRKPRVDTNIDQSEDELMLARSRDDHLDEDTGDSLDVPVTSEDTEVITSEDSDSDTSEKQDVMTSEDSLSATSETDEQSQNKLTEDLQRAFDKKEEKLKDCLLYTSPSPET